jgi:hypothetical protein
MAVGVASNWDAVSRGIAWGWSQQQAATRIQQYHNQHGSLPSDQKGTQLIQDIDDPWDNAMRYVRNGKRDYVLISSGEDGEFGTQDDMSFAHQIATVGSGQGQNQQQNQTPSQPVPATQPTS